MKAVRLKQAVAFVAALSFATAALAQYVWLDEKGVKQFSDMPPPASVPQNRILKQPAAAAPAQAQGAATDKIGAQGEAAAGSVKSKLPMTTADKNADFLKRRNEQAEKEKKAADEAKRKADNAQDCERARGYAHSLEAGERIARTDKSGERAYLSDEERARELQDVRRTLANCK